MATYSALPATLNLVATVGNDFTLSLTVTENGSSWVATGATLATDIIDSSGAVVATDFTTAASTGTVSLSLTDTNTTTLGVGVYSYRLSVTKSSLTRDWIAGTLSIVEAGVGGTSTSSASLSISNSAVTLGITSTVGAASNITVLDQAGNFTGTNVEDVLAEIDDRIDAHLADTTDAHDASAISVVDASSLLEAVTVEAALMELASQFNASRFLPSAALAQTMPRTDLANGSLASLSSGRQSFMSIYLTAGQVINSITVFAGTTAAVSPTNQWFSIYSAAGTKLAVTSDGTTGGWATNSSKTLTISGGYTVTVTGLHYIGVMVAAATVPTMVGCTMSFTALTSMPPVLCGFDSVNTGLTTPATAPSSVTISAQGAGSFYAYVS